MGRYFIRLAYNGAPFSGWQVQPGEVTVQQTLQQALSTVLRSEVAVTGAGRTDTGVHARMMVAHADLPLTESEAAGIIHSLNGILGRDVAVYAITKVPDGAHARFDAVSRTYRYYVATRPSPFVNRLSWLAPPRLDFEAMQQAAELIPGRRDFTSFSKLHTDTRTNICDVRSAVWSTPDSEGLRYFEITADRFLRNMVRAVVGTLVDVGRHKIAPSEVSQIIERRDRSAAGSSMPPHALYLWEVAYPEEIYNPNIQ